MKKHELYILLGEIHSFTLDAPTMDTINNLSGLDDRIELDGLASLWMWNKYIQLIESLAR